MDITEASKIAKKASIDLAACSSDVKNAALKAIADTLVARKDDIIKANQEDIERSQKENLSMPLLKRLKFDEVKIDEVVKGIHSLINLKDPVGETLWSSELDEGLDLYRISCPIGVIGIIFESRPDALVQISTLCLKSGNAALLKGGREASKTNKILTEIIKEATSKVGIPEGWIHLLETREDVTAMLKLDQYIDLLIPRGSNEFVQYIMNNSTIPVMGHADGICHCYVDQFADLDMACDIVLDSKTQYVAVCNATETLLVHEKVAKAFLPMLKKTMDDNKVTLIGCSKTKEIIDVLLASEEDWETEYLDYILSIRVVADLKDAIVHINTYGSGHTDAIITANQENAKKFMELVDTANAFWNCSTRFSDGFRYGFGAEVGISTNKLHARGPVGLDGLLIYKYKLIGNGQKVADYANKTKTFKHNVTNKKFQ